MINGKRIFVVLPAYNAAKTLQSTVAEIPGGAALFHLKLQRDFSIG
jgi:hypothetical protein